jgi:hypothetical protein
MTNPFYIVLILLTVHFVADFLLQNDWMAINKSKHWGALTLHVLIYSLAFSWLGWKFALITFVTHFITDAITSRMTRALYYPVFHRHWFFAVIGLDQLIHAWSLTLTYIYLH